MAKGYLLLDMERILTSGNASPDGVGAACAALQQAALLFKAELADAVFRLRKHRQLCLLIEKYHSALVVLMDEVLERREAEAEREFLDTACNVLQELLLFLEKRFSRYLDPDNELPPHYISLSQKDWPLRLRAMEGAFTRGGAGALFGFVGQNLLRFVNARRHKHLTLKTLLYRKELIAEMEVLLQSPKALRLPAALHELLVYWNYNSRGYLEFYSREVALAANGLPLEGQRQYLARAYKKFTRLYCNTRMALHPGKDAIKVMVENWYESQLVLLDQGKVTGVVPYGKALKGLLPVVRLPTTPLIRCTLSASQLGIVLRAADQAGVIRAPSLSAVFKALVPHLGTVQTPVLSPDSVRSKSYLFDEQDRAGAIAVLEQVIEKIRKL